MENIQKYRVHIIVGAIALAVGFIFGAVWKSADMGENNGAYSPTRDATSTTDSEASSTALMPEKQVTLFVADQKPGSIVFVENVSVNVPSWVVIAEDESGKPARILGAQLFVRGMTIGSVDLLRPMIAGATFHALIYRDNGDNKFDYKVDTPMIDARGKMVQSVFDTK